MEADEKLEAWEEEKGREGAAEENGFLCAAAVGLGFCWKADVAATVVMSTITGGVVGWVLGMSKKTVVAA